MRAQVSIEYLLITGFSLLLLAPILVLFSTQSVHVDEQFQESQAEQAARDIAASAQRVYYAGPPSKETLTVQIPRGVDEFVISEQAIEFVFSDDPFRSVYVHTDVSLVPASLNPAQGTARIEVQATQAGVVVQES